MATVAQSKRPSLSSRTVLLGAANSGSSGHQRAHASIAVTSTTPLTNHLRLPDNQAGNVTVMPANITSWKAKMDRQIFNAQTSKCVVRQKTNFDRHLKNL